MVLLWNARYAPRVAHYLFNFSDGDREQAAVLLEAKAWGIRTDDRYGDVLAPGDVALIYVAMPKAVFIGRAELATPVQEWTPSETETYPGHLPSGVSLSQVEQWDPPVPMKTVVSRIDPTGSNPLVQANAKRGFQIPVVQITAFEYEAALAISRTSLEA
jgi:hypothetical protein